MADSLISRQKETSSASGIRTLERGLAVLEVLATAQSGMAITEIARRLKLPLGTTHRILRTLLGAAYVEQDAETRRYGLGLKVLELRGAIIYAAIKLALDIRPLLRALAQQGRVRAHLAVFRVGNVIYIDKLDSLDDMATYVPIGMQAPAHATSLGKAILAFSREEDVEAYLTERTLVRFTAHTITDPDRFRQELATTRARGYAIEAEEVRDGQGCIGVPIFDRSGWPIAALSVAASIEDIQGRQAELIHLAMATARAASAMYGYYSPGRSPFEPETEPAAS